MFLAYFALMMEHWHWWALIVLVLLIGEAFVPGLVLGSWLSGHWLEDWPPRHRLVGIPVRCGLAGAVLSLLFLRPPAMRKWFSGESVGTGIDALPGRSVRVTAPFDLKTGRGRGRVRRRLVD